MALITLACKGRVADVVIRLERALRERGQTEFARVDHAQGAADAGMALRPTVLLIFGNPTVGTPLMQRDQLVGLELPLKMLVWEDTDLTARLSYSDPHELAQHFDLGDKADATLDAMSRALAAIARQAQG